MIPDWPRAARLAAAAFLLGWLTSGFGLSNLAFLWIAYHHGGL
jgi:hypothetical protein